MKNLSRECINRLLIAICLMVSRPACSQEVTAAITGSVVDPTGASIVNADVVAKDIEKGTTYTAPTNDTGIFNIQRLTVGNYHVKVTARGFQTAFSEPITLVLNQVVRVDFQMKVGKVTDTLAVTADAPLLQTDTTQLNNTVNSSANVNLPLATRNYIQLTLLVPGSVNPNPQSLNNGDNTGPAAAGRPYINGNREQANLLDGMDNNQVSDNLVGFMPSVDAIGI